MHSTFNILYVRTKLIGILYCCSPSNAASNHNHAVEYLHTMKGILFIYIKTHFIGRELAISIEKKKKE